MNEKTETRQVDFHLVRAEDDADGLTLEGYGAVFDTPTRIDSWEGRFDEIIAPGAFKRTIAHKGTSGVRLQFDHGQHPLVGSIPIGSIREMREDARGLYVKARLHDNWLVQPVRDAIADGSISGMSFRFRVVSDEWDHEKADTPTRTLREVELFEVGPVVWPAYEETSVGVRAAKAAAALMDPEQRAELARALVESTPYALVREDTASGPADHDPAPEGTGRPKKDVHKRLHEVKRWTQPNKDAA